MTRQLVIGRHSGKPAAPVHCFLFSRIRVERDMLETIEHRTGASIGLQQGPTRAIGAAANGSDVGRFSLCQTRVMYGWIQRNTSNNYVYQSD